MISRFSGPGRQRSRLLKNLTEDEQKELEQRALREERQATRKRNLRKQKKDELADRYYERVRTTLISMAERPDKNVVRRTAFKSFRQSSTAIQRQRQPSREVGPIWQPANRSGLVQNLDLDAVVRSMEPQSSRAECRRCNMSSAIALSEMGMTSRSDQPISRRGRRLLMPRNAGPPSAHNPRHSHSLQSYHCGLSHHTGMSHDSARTARSQSSKRPTTVSNLQHSRTIATPGYRVEETPGAAGSPRSSRFRESIATRSGRRIFLSRMQGFDQWSSTPLCVEEPYSGPIRFEESLRQRRKADEVAGEFVLPVPKDVYYSSGDELRNVSNDSLLTSFPGATFQSRRHINDVQGLRERRHRSKMLLCTVDAVAVGDSATALGRSVATAGGMGDLDGPAVVEFEAARKVQKYLQPL